jgi:signal peptidase I
VKAVLLRGLEVSIVSAVIIACGWVVLQFWLPVRVAGGSMRPALAPGDLVVVDRRAPVRVGRIALLESQRHGRVLHRVIAVEDGGSVRTRGDSNAVEDFDALPATAVVGPVVCVVRIGGLVERWRGSASCATMTAQ